MRKKKLAIFVTAAVLSAAAVAAQTEQNPMTFFVTSAGSGNGADFGGIAGADKHCQSLAQAAGAGKHQWRAYLSTTGGGSAMNARDRIGKGPWHNVKGDLISRNVDELHDGVNNINRLKALTEKGGQVNNAVSGPNMHDILTGSSRDGRAVTDKGDTTCKDWTSGSEGSAIVGHFDRIGFPPPEAARSWNSSHPTKGCSQPALVSTGGAGLLYCFAVK
jgi:hypothetical protein